MRWERSVAIDAPARTILGVLTDLERWPEWNGAMREVRITTAGPVAVGTAAEVRLDGGPKAEWRITALDDTGFSWESKVFGVRSVADHRIGPGPEGGCRVVLSVEMSGPFAGLFRPLLARASNRNLPREAAGLKRRAESLVTA